MSVGFVPDVQSIEHLDFEIEEPCEINERAHSYYGTGSATHIAHVRYPCCGYRISALLCTGCAKAVMADGRWLLHDQTGLGNSPCFGEFDSEKAVLSVKPIKE